MERAVVPTPCDHGGARRVAGGAAERWSAPPDQARPTQTDFGSV